MIGRGSSADTHSVNEDMYICNEQDRTVSQTVFCAVKFLDQTDHECRRIRGRRNAQSDTVDTHWRERRTRSARRWSGWTKLKWRHEKTQTGRKREKWHVDVGRSESMSSTKTDSTRTCRGTSTLQSKDSMQVDTDVYRERSDTDQKGADGSEWLQTRRVVLRPSSSSLGVRSLQSRSDDICFSSFEHLSVIFLQSLSGTTIPKSPRAHTSWWSQSAQDTSRYSSDR